MLTAKHLLRAWPRCPGQHVSEYAHALGKEMQAAHITTASRAAAFLGQLAWECDEGRALVEAQTTAAAYEGRKVLGNNEPGDGVRFRGRGFIHLTGRHNYLRLSGPTGTDLVQTPERAAEPAIAAKVAALYWLEKGCNALADEGNWRRITRVINGADDDEAPAYHSRRMGKIANAFAALCGDHEAI